jgi:hypothetical protein
MAVPAQLSLSTKKEVLTLLKRRATAEWVSAVSASTRQLQDKAPEEVSRVKAILKEVAGRQTSVSEVAMKQLVSKGVLPGLPTELVKKLRRPGAAKEYRRPLAGALASEIQGDMGDIIKYVVNTNPGKYGPVVERMGNPDTNQWAAWWQRAMMWEPKTGKKQFAGQLANMSGKTFESLCKSTLTHRNGVKESSEVVAAYNRRRLEGVVGQLGGGKVEPLTREHRARQAFSYPRFYEKIRDGHYKELSDGMNLSFNDVDELLVARIVEDKHKSVEADVFPQMDRDIDRILERGIRLADGRYFPPGKIHMPLAPTAGGPQTELVAFVEGAIPRMLPTPKRHRVKVVGVESANHRDFVRDIFIEYRRRLASTKVQP